MSKFEFDLRQYVQRNGPRFILGVVASALETEVLLTKVEEQGEWCKEYLELSNELKTILAREVSE